MCRSLVIVQDIGIHLLTTDWTVGFRITQQFAAVDADTLVRSKTDPLSNRETRRYQKETHVSP